MTFPRPLPVVEVEWLDAASHRGWRDIEELQKADPQPHEGGSFENVRTVGYLCRNDAERVVICQNIAPDGRAAHTMAIPKVWVKRVRRLAPAERGKA